MTEALATSDLVAVLPPRIWYLTSNGTDMWCRRPYGFLFSTGEAAERFAAAMGTGEALFAVGTEAKVFLTDAILSGLRDTSVTRIFVDPSIDPDTGDVFGTILRLGAST